MFQNGVKQTRILGFLAKSAENGDHDGNRQI